MFFSPFTCLLSVVTYRNDLSEVVVREKSPHGVKLGLMIMSLELSPLSLGTIYVYFHLRKIMVFF